MGVNPPTIYVNGVKADGSHIFTPFDISHGRSNPSSQPDSPSLSISWDSLEFAPVLGDLIRVDAPLPSPSNGEYDDNRVYYNDPMMGYDGIWVTPVVTRFTGEVTEANIEEYAGLPVQVNIEAINKQAHLGRILISIDRPAEDEVARVNAIAAAGGVSVTIQGNPGPILAPYLIEKDVLSALHEVCLSTGGLVWSNGDGTIIYGTGDHRKDEAPIIVLTANNILSGIEWDATVSDLINKITVAWGPQGSETQVTYTMQDSIERYGVRATNAQTMLNSEQDASYTGQLILARRAYPFHRITDVLLDSEYMDERDVALRDFFTVDVSSAALLPIPPDPGPAGILAEWIIEGWQEEWVTPYHINLQIAVTDRARFALTTLRPWLDAQPNTWQQELDRGAWLDALINIPV